MSVPAAFVPPCIPTRAVPIESTIKHDGYRLQLRRAGRWCDFSLAAASSGPAAIPPSAKLAARSFTLDGEAMVCGPDRVAIFDRTHRRGAVQRGYAVLYALDLLELDCDDIRALPLGGRKKRLAASTSSGDEARATAGLERSPAPSCRFAVTH
jgi:ATP-dependent DNA ligase